MEALKTEYSAPPHKLPSSIEMFSNKKITIEISYYLYICDDIWACGFLLGLSDINKIEQASLE